MNYLNSFAFGIVVFSVSLTGSMLLAYMLIPSRPHWASFARMGINLILGAGAIAGLFGWLASISVANAVWGLPWWATGLCCFSVAFGLSVAQMQCYGVIGKRTAEWPKASNTNLEKRP